MALKYMNSSKEINFIQIGANDGDWKSSNDRMQEIFISNAEFHGVMLEPVPGVFETLEKNVKGANATNILLLDFKNFTL